MLNSPSRENIHQLFNEISPTYDLVNRILSLGIDHYWRRKISSLIPKKDSIHFLDLATGTGDQLFSILKRKPNATAVGIDLAEEMLEIAKIKAKKHSFEKKATFQVASATELPFKENTFDYLTMSFGIRNIPCIKTCFKEMHRVLKPGGTLFILEFSLPKNTLIRSSYLLYLRHILPKIGRLISKHPKAYTYLNQTIETFPHGKLFCDLLNEEGFHTTFQPFTFGIVNLYSAVK
jgi:demethylmenaquinone methyltransferase / 2-methoxy-6-polyprenyl-1,4-benzoquinol methylase